MEHTYVTIYQALVPEEIATLVNAIQLSGKYEVGEWSHIVVKNTKTPVGYFGDDTFEYVDRENKGLRRHHRNLFKICEEALENRHKENLRLIKKRQLLAA